MGVWVIGLLLTTGCARSGKKPLTFALVPKLLDNPVFNMAKIGAEDAAKELGGIQIEWTAPVVSDAAQQANIVEGLIERGVDGIAISANDPDALKEVIDRALEAGIPTICFDSDSPNSRRLTFYGTNNLEAGRKVAELLVEAMGPEGTVAIMTGTPGADNLEVRIQGVKEVLGQYPKIKIVSIQACDDDISKGVAQVEAVLQAHPDLGGWAMVGGWPLFTPPPGPLASVKPPGKTKVVAFDALPEELDYVRQGYVYALVAQKLYEWGYQSVKILHGIINGQKYPSFVDSGVDIVKKENVEEYAKKWERLTKHGPAGE